MLTDSQILSGETHKQLKIKIMRGSRDAKEVGALDRSSRIEHFI